MSYMTSDSVREYAKKKGLLYSDVGSKELYLLWNMLDEALKEFSKSDESAKNMLMTMSKIEQTDIVWNQDGTISRGEIFLSGSYFNKRECISFNYDGFIGFAGWASTNNLRPIVNTFVDWVNKVKNISGEKR